VRALGLVYPRLSPHTGAHGRCPGQERVDAAPALAEAIGLITQWLRAHDLLDASDRSALWPRKPALRCALAHTALAHCALASGRCWRRRDVGGGGWNGRV
jgi:hypothetical protein